jgi:N-acetylated-alpha-linked acidic dipeptidase
MKKIVLFILTMMILNIHSNCSLFAQTIENQSDIFKQFNSHLNAENLKEWMKKLSSHPHHVGSKFDKDNAEYIASLFKSWGYDTHIEEFYVLFPTPKTRILEMLKPEKFSALLSEPALKEDSTSNQDKEQLPTYNAYSADGDITAELVYVNFGVPKDYDVLIENGIDVKGKIVIARYGGSWRGIKPKVAAEHGAIGCIIYSDPKEDGYYEGDVYPKGPYRNENGVQRGSVADMPVYPGDPLTPFVGATKDAKRLSIKEAETIMKIPVLPISYKDALPLLRALEGPVVPESWRGALPLTYHMGPGKSLVHLKLKFNWDIKPIYDVISKINGSEFPDEWIIRGNHHDAWVNGASDPISGQVAMMAEAKSVGELVKIGWKPKRTMIYCAWDGEEPGLLGSTEWVETHTDELKQKGAVYINSDGNGRGFFFAGGPHILQNFINDISRNVNDPEKNISVYERWRANVILNGSPDRKKEALEKKDIQIGALGSGSDFTPFLQHIGIASLNIGFGGENEGGEYHSIYDSFDHYVRFDDPEFKYGIALAEIAGHAMIQLAGSDILPFRFKDFVEEINQYIKDIVKLTDDMRENTVNKNKMIDEKIYLEYFDPTKTYIPPELDKPVPFLNFSSLQNAIAKVQLSADNYSTALNLFWEQHISLSSEKRKELNDIIMTAERYLTSKEGLPKRPWFVHQIYAPGLYTGYGVKTLPGVREAIEQRNWDEASVQIEKVASVLENYAKVIDKASLILKGQ